MSLFSNSDVRLSFGNILYIMVHHKNMAKMPRKNKTTPKKQALAQPGPGEKKKSTVEQRPRGVGEVRTKCGQLSLTSAISGLVLSPSRPCLQAGIFSKISREVAIHHKRKDRVKHNNA